VAPPAILKCTRGSHSHSADPFLGYQRDDASHAPAVVGPRAPARSSETARLEYSRRSWGLRRASPAPRPVREPTPLIHAALESFLDCVASREAASEVSSGMVRFISRWPCLNPILVRWRVPKKDKLTGWSMVF
jgi:hypothetical protein